MGLHFRSKIFCRADAKIWATIGAVIWTAWASSASAKIAIDIDGLDGELKDAALNGLELQQYADRSVSTVQINRLFAKANDDIATALQPYGFYHAHVQGSIDRGDQDGDYRVHFKVTPGEPVIVHSADVKISGDATELPAIKNALRAFRPQPGDRLEHGVYEGSKSNITNVLQTFGYFDTKLTEHRVEVLQSANTADVTVHWDPGQRYRFGEVGFTDTQFDNDFLKRYVPWKPDEFYTTDELLTLQQRLVDADYFSTVSVQPDLEHKHDGVVPIEALLIPAKPMVYKGGVYVSTDTGPGTRLSVERRWLNDAGHKIGGEINYAQRLEEYSAFYRIPKPGLQSRSYNFAAGYRDEETDSSTSRLARISASEMLEQWHGYTRTLSLQYLNGDFEIADEQHSSKLFYADAELKRKHVDNLLFPTRGLSLTYGVRFAPESYLTDTSFFQARAEAKWIRPASSRSRLIFRAELGAMAVKNFDALPPELRFFAGGDRSIRGFDYQQIGETNDAGGVIGGRYLTIASAEYEHYFLPNWGAAVFVDAGDAYTYEFNANVGAGIGLRWKSPIGIVRLDIATPIVTQLDKSIRFHIVIGPDL
jgi:translocation and assembly module TamA